MGPRRQTPVDWPLQYPLETLCGSGSALGSAAVARRSRRRRRGRTRRLRRAPAGTASTRRRGFSMPTPETMPPRIIRTPAITIAEVEGRGRGVGGGGRRPASPRPAAGRRSPAPPAAVPWRRRPRAGRRGRERRVAEVVVERRAEVGGDHGAEDGDRQQAGDPGDAVVDAGGDADVAFVDRVEHGRGQRRHRRREAEAEDEDRRQHVGDVVGVGADPQQQQQADAADDRADASSAAAARCPRRSCRSAARGRRGSGRDRRRRQARLERRVAGHLLEEEADEEEAADQAGVGGERGQVGDREVADPEEAEGRASGGGRAPRGGRRGAKQATPATSGTQTSGSPQPCVGCSIRAKTGPPRPSGGEQRSRASRCRGRRRGRGSPRPSAGSAPRSPRSAAG